MSGSSQTVDHLAAEATICVVGSAMVDMIAYVDRIPEAGETIRGRDFALGFGGKGANQAVMAALLGARVCMVGCVGDDVFGPMTIANFERLGIDVAHVRTLAGTSGVAPIWVEPSGANRIVIVAGANGGVSKEQVSAAFDGRAAPDVVLCQLEIPQPIVRRAFELGRRAGSLNVLNPAPVDRLDPEIIELSDWLIPNEHEFAEIAQDLGMDSDGDVETRIARMSETTRTNVVVTRGETGASYCLYRDDDGVQHVPAPRVRAIDTTGAGDAFVGAFAYALASGGKPEQAVAFGCACAATSVTRPGTQSSFPRGEEVETIRTQIFEPEAPGVHPSVPGARGS